LTAGFVAASTQLLGAAPLDRVRENGSLRLCANPSALPFSNRSGGTLRGFQVELAEAVAREMGLGLTPVWVRALGAGKGSDCDAVMDAVADAAGYEREGKIGPLRAAAAPLRFTKPYAASGVFLAVRSGSPARRFDELGAGKIGVVVGSLAHEVLAKRGLNVSVFPFQDEIVAALDRGELGAGAVGSPFLGWYRHEHPDARVVIPEGYEPEPGFRWNVSIGLWRADDALVEVVNAAIDRVMQKRIPDQIYARYGVTYYPPHPASAPGNR
jgi:ABC-type amino acid transport substrate-binding protein